AIDEVAGGVEREEHLQLGRVRDRVEVACNGRSGGRRSGLRLGRFWNGFRLRRRRRALRSRRFARATTGGEQQERDEEARHAAVAILAACQWLSPSPGLRPPSPRLAGRGR